MADKVSAITLRSTSRQEDAALTALADLASAVRDWTTCRIVGGHMVTIHVALVNADTDHRPTADADLAAPVAILRDAGFAERLTFLGYQSVDGSRLSRTTQHGDAFIDLIAPAPASRTLHNQAAGRFTIDMFPGIQYALNEPPVMVDIESVPLEGRVTVPTASRCPPSPPRSS